MSSVSHVFLPASIHVYAAVPNPVPRADRFPIATRLRQVRRKDVESISGYGPSSLEEF
jgi:hypothetical protein